MEIKINTCEAIFFSTNKNSFFILDFYLIRILKNSKIRYWQKDFQYNIVFCGKKQVLQATFYSKLIYFFCFKEIDGIFWTREN